MTDDKHLDSLAASTDQYLALVEAALEEARENVRKLTGLRSCLMRDIQGRDPKGLEAAFDAAGMIEAAKRLDEAAANGAGEGISTNPPPLQRDATISDLCDAVNAVNRVLTNNGLELLTGISFTESTWRELKRLRYWNPISFDPSANTTSIMGIPVSTTPDENQSKKDAK